MQPFRIVKFRGGLAVTFTSPEGKRHRFALTEKNKKDATPEAVEIVTEFFKKPPSDITTHDVLEAYRVSLGERPSSPRCSPETPMRKFFGPYKPAQVTEELVMNYRATRRNMRTGKPVSDETLWTELGALRDAYSYARKRRIISAEDVPYIPRPAKPAPRDRPLTREEIAKLLFAAKEVPHLYITLLLLLGTAGRVTAVLELEWSRVNFDKDTIDLRVNKKGPRKGRAIVPMNAGLKQELLKWREMSDCRHVVSFHDKPIKSVKTAFTAAHDKAGLKDVRIHDIRHTAAVWMLEAGSSIQRISQYLGHTTIDQTFKVYARYQPDFLRAEAAALDVTPLLSGNLDSASDFEEDQVPSVAVHFTSAQTSITFDRRVEPDFANFVKDHADAILVDLRKQFQDFRSIN